MNLLPYCDWQGGSNFQIIRARGFPSGGSYHQKAKRLQTIEVNCFGLMTLHIVISQSAITIQFDPGNPMDLEVRFSREPELEYEVEVVHRSHTKMLLASSTPAHRTNDPGARREQFAPGSGSAVSGTSYRRAILTLGTAT
jgi:hypothetical protein